MRLRIHPLFIAFLFVYTLLGGIGGYLVAFLAVFLHEVSHYALARIAGAKDLSITLMPYGASLAVSEDVPHVGAILLAGPLSNLCIASFCLALSWLVPELYGYLEGFLSANVHIAILNLLPAYPLDGGRLFRQVAKGRWAKVFTEGMTLLLGGTAIGLFFFGGMRNGTLLTFGVFMTTYFFAFSLRRSHVCSSDAPLWSLVSTDREGRIRAVRVKKNGETLIRLSPNKVAALVLKYERETPVAEAAQREGLILSSERKKHILRTRK